MSVPRRPLSLKITALGIFLLAIWNLWRAKVVAQQNALLQQLGATLDPRLRLVMAVVWAVAFLLLAFGLWQRRPVVRVLLPVTIFLYGSYHLLIILFFVPSPAARQGWLAHLLVFAGATAWTFWVGLKAARLNATIQSGNDEAGHPL